MKKLTKNIIFISAGLLTIGIILSFYKKKNKKLGKLEKDYTKQSLPNGVNAYIPKSKLGKYDVIFVWGGISYANPEWMKEQIPEDLFYGNIIIITPYSIKWNTLKGIYNEFLSQNHLKNSINKTSMIGFSAGGKEVYENYNKKLKFVGLIDPSTKNSYLSIPFKKNTYMIYNDANWSGYSNIQKALPVIANVITTGGGHVEKVNLSHKAIPEYFFIKYYKKIK